MWLTRVFLERWPLVWVLIALTTFAGVLSARSLVIQRLPATESPTVGMRVGYPGASTTELRDTIVRPIEDQIAGQQYLQHVDSTVQTGSATISSSFELGSPSTQDLTEVIQAFNAARSQLPTNLISPPIRIFDPNAATVVSIGLTSKTMTQQAIAELASGQIAPAVEQIAGVSNVYVSGSLQPAFNVTVDPNALAGYGLTLGDVISTLSANNVRAPGGIAYQPGRETQIDVRGDITSPQSVEDLPILNPANPYQGGGASPTLYGPTPFAGQLNGWTRPSQSVLVGDVAKVTQGSVPQRIYTFVNGHTGAELQVQKTNTASEISVSNAVIATLPQLRAQFPAIDFHVDFVQSTYSKEQVNGVIHTLLLGMLFTAILMLLFLQSWRNAVVVLIAIPTSLCVALFAMHALHLTLDTISLLAMTLAIGILIDDSTVVLENVTRHHDEGEPELLAALNGRSEIGMAAIVITLVDVVVFLPIAFIGGPVGVQLAEFGIVVTVATLTSLFISFTITPALAGIWSMKSHWQPPKLLREFDRRFEQLRARYVERWLPAALDRPTPVLVISGVLLVAALLLVPLGLVGEEYIPSSDQGELFFIAQYPPGTPLEQLRSTMQTIEAQVDAIPDLQSEITSAGGYNSPFGGFVLEGSTGQITVYLKPDRKQSTDHWAAYLQDLAKRYAAGASVIVKPASDPTQGGPRQPIDMLLSMRNGGDPSSYTARVRQALQQTRGATDVNDSAENLLPQVAVDFNRPMARFLGASVGQAASAVQAAFGGAVATSLESPNGLIQVEVIYPTSAQNSLANVLAIPLRGAGGGIVRIGDFARLTLDPSPVIITRTNRADVVHLDADVANGSALSNVVNDFMKRVRGLHLPAALTIRPAPGGQQDLMRQTLVGLGLSLIVSVILVYLLMVALYNDFRDPLIILFAIPVATVGALGALFLTHQSLNLFSLIGTLLLVGLVTKNGILLVDYTNTVRRRGSDKRAGVIEGAKTRFRPIMMTTIAMIAGMIPLAIGFEAGSQVRSSLGVVVIGGLTSSLILTFFVVPIMYMRISPEKLPEPLKIDETPRKSERGTIESEATPRLP